MWVKRENGHEKEAFEKLQELVNHFLDKGWGLCGGISITLSEDENTAYFMVAQAIYHPD